MKTHNIFGSNRQGIEKILTYVAVRYITELFIRADFDFRRYDCLHIAPTQNILITQRIFKTTSITTYSYRLQCLYEVVAVSCLNRVMLTSESWLLQNEMKLSTLRSDV